MKPTKQLNINVLELVELAIEEDKYGNQSIIKTSKLVVEKAKALQASTELGFQPYFVDLTHFDGKTVKTDLYYVASRVFFKTLSRAFSNHAMEIYEKPYSLYYDITKDYIQEVVSAMYLGYTNAKGEHFDGYVDGVTDFRQIALVGYKAINAMLYTNGVQGRNIGKVVTVSDNVLIDLVAKYEYHKHNTSNINMARYNKFISDIRQNIPTKQILTFDCIVSGDYVNTNGKMQIDNIANVLGLNRRTVCRYLNVIKQTALDVVSNYNMAINDFIKYLQTA